jgi:Raf kinase inhibitor-like YbhB/YbcL family protein
MPLTLSSQSFRDGDYLPEAHILSKDFGFGCAGGNQSPHLTWSGAPTGSGFWHWLVVNIPVTTTELPLDAGNPHAGKLPVGALQTRTDFGKPGYGGPCPPQNDHPHRYIFTVFAVSQEALPVTSDTSAAVVGFNLNFSTLAKAALMGLFKR